VLPCYLCLVNIILFNTLKFPPTLECILSCDVMCWSVLTGQQMWQCTAHSACTHVRTHTHTQATDCYCSKETFSLKLRLISLQTESVNSSQCCSVTLTVYQTCLEHTRAEWQAVQLQIKDLSIELGEFNFKPSNRSQLYITVTCTDNALSSIHIKCVSDVKEATKNIHDCSTHKIKAPQPFETSEPLIPWHSVTPQKAWNLSNTAVRTTNIATLEDFQFMQTALLKRTDRLVYAMQIQEGFVFFSRQSIFSVTIFHTVVTQTGRVVNILQFWW